MSLPRMRAWTLALVAVGLLLKLWLAASLPLFGDEAFYWLEAQHPAWAHDDVPALTPWLIASSAAVANGSEWALRLPFLLLGLASLLLIWRMAATLGGPTAAWRALLCASLLPLFAVNGLLALPDVPLTLAVLVCLHGLQLSLKRADGRSLSWLAGGLLLGCLSHYRFVMPLLAAGLWLLIDPAGRALLRLPRFWAAGAGGLALGLAPLLSQQWLNQGRGLAFQFVDRHPWQFQPMLLLDPLLQALVSTPLLYLALLAVAVLALRMRADAPTRLFTGFGLLLLTLYWLLGAFADSERSRLHWPLPAYLALIVVLAVHGPRLLRRYWRLAAPTLALALLGCLAGASWLALAALAPQRLVAFDLYPDNFAGWHEAGQQARQALAGLPADTVVVADNFMLAAQLQFALGEHRRVFSLDHPLNRKHGRQGELARMQRDEAALQTLAATVPRLLIAELSASRLRVRPAWFARLCERYPSAQLRFDVSLHRGQKRLLGWVDRRLSTDTCLPPALAYLDPLLDARAGSPISGWALRGGRGIDALRARVGAQVVALEYGIDLPSLEADLGGRFDPHGTRLGFRGRLPAPLTNGDYDLNIEAADGERWVPVLVRPLRIRDGSVSAE